MYNPIEVIQAIRLMLSEYVLFVRTEKAMNKAIENKYKKQVGKITPEDINPYFRVQGDTSSVQAPVLEFTEDEDGTPQLVSMGLSTTIGEK